MNKRREYFPLQNWFFYVQRCDSFLQKMNNPHALLIYFINVLFHLFTGNKLRSSAHGVSTHTLKVIEHNCVWYTSSRWCVAFVNGVSRPSLAFLDAQRGLHESENNWFWMRHSLAPTHTSRRALMGMGISVAKTVLTEMYNWGAMETEHRHFFKYWYMQKLMCILLPWIFSNIWRNKSCNSKFFFTWQCRSEIILAIISSPKHYINISLSTLNPPWEAKSDITASSLTLFKICA